MFEKQDIEKNLRWLETVKTNVLKDLLLMITTAPVAYKLLEHLYE